MAQNPYNNYIKRQQQNPTNNFKEKVKNSLGGVPAQQNTTMPNTSITTPPVSQSKPIQTYTNTNITTTPQNPITTPPVAQNTTPAPVAPQPTTPATSQPTTQATGMMSLSEVNNAYTPQETTQPTTPVPQEIAQPITQAEVEDVASDPEVQRQAYANGKTPQQMAQELLEEQKKQLQKDWELKQEQIKQQQEQAQNSFNQSVTDSENAYNESIDKINQDRYNRQQDLNVSGSNRGIQYSPQQLGLETVANINTNKNVTEAGKQRNELLNKLQQQLNEINSNLLMSSQQSINDYNKALGQLNADYMNKIMDWEWNQQQTDDERKWQESQTEADRAWQEKMDAENKKWQSGENALDREKGRSGSGYSGGGYSSSYSPYSRSRYGGYNNYSSSRMGGYNDEAFDLSDEITQQTIDNEFKKLSTDAFNATQSGGMSDLMERGSMYSDFTSPMYDAFSGQNNIVDERLNNTRETALGTMYNRAYARDTNGVYQKGDTLYQNKRPLREDYMQKVKDNKIKDQAKFYDKLSNDKSKKTNLNTASRNVDRFNELKAPLEKAKIKPSDTKNKPKQSSWSKQVQDTSNKQSASIKKTTEKVTKSVKKSTANVKNSTSNAKKNTKTSSKNFKTKNNKALSKSAQNLKNNIKKIFKKK